MSLYNNGYINLHSVPNIGTTFHIYLPAVAVALEEEIPASPKIRQGRETILVAEDNEEVRRLIKTILTTYGYAIIEATDGDDAIDKFNKHRNTDLLIIDLIMPKKNGKEAYEEISKINPQIKVLFISGYTRDVVLDKGIEGKEFDFIPKPLSPRELLQKVEEMLDRK